MPLRRIIIHSSLLIILLLLIGCQGNDGGTTAVAPAADGTPTLNPTQQAIAAVLTYQAANPRPTRTTNQFVNVIQTDTAIMAATREMATQLAGTPPTSTPTPSPTGTPIPRAANLTIPQGNAPTLDGRIASGEWDDSAVVTIQPADGTPVTVHLRHDGTQLYLAYTGLDQPIAYFPELWLDEDNNSGATLKDDDRWYHVSTLACAGRATHLFADCALPQDWQTTLPRDNADAIEMAIYLPDLEPRGLLLSVMSVTYTEDKRDFWPETAVATAPGSWAQISFATND